MNRVIHLVSQAIQHDKVILVVSALGGVTDLLIKSAQLAAAGDEAYKSQLAEVEGRHLNLVRELLPLSEQSSTLSLVKSTCNELENLCEGVFLLGELSDRSLDAIMGFGELFSSSILSARFHSLAIDNAWTDSRKFIRTDSAYGSAAVNFKITNQQIQGLLESNHNSLYIFPGFIASDEQGFTTTLGRGGSDYSAAILAAAANACVLEIWTDVNGMMTADPRLVSQAKPIPHLSYKEAMELSHFGAKVIYPPTIQPVMNKGIPLKIKNTFATEEQGTLIETTTPPRAEIARGISSLDNMALLSLEGSGMLGVPGISRRMFEALAKERINVILITQSSSEHS
ncbi:MAG TPA: aspartate kinase, partial [Bacteroidia bacterium]|nr:aspartate kinase [Bacteroidia bacterium]